MAEPSLFIRLSYRVRAKDGSSGPSFYLMLTLLNVAVLVRQERIHRVSLALRARLTWAIPSWLTTLSSALSFGAKYLKNCAVAA
jgi:hypothetical protein